jgi:hypothetical protein
MLDRDAHHPGQASPTQCGACCSKQRRGVTEREMSRADGKLGIRSRGELGDALA